MECLIKQTLKKSRFFLPCSHILDVAIWYHWACSSFLCKCWALMGTWLIHFMFDFFNLHKYLFTLYNFKSHVISSCISLLMLRFRGYWFNPSIFKFSRNLSPIMFNSHLGSLSIHLITFKGWKNMYLGTVGIFYKEHHFSTFKLSCNIMDTEQVG